VLAGVREKRQARHPGQQRRRLDDAALEFLTEKEWDFNLNVNLKGVSLHDGRDSVSQGDERADRQHRVDGGHQTGADPSGALYGVEVRRPGLYEVLCARAGEIRDHGQLRVPGYVKTSMQDGRSSGREAARDDAGGGPRGVRPLTPLGRLCLPEDVADAVGFLVSPDAKFITGEELNVTGGANL
jgi:hypothetical protein